MAVAEGVSLCVASCKIPDPGYADAGMNKAVLIAKKPQAAARKVVSFRLFCCITSLDYFPKVQIVRLAREQYDSVAHHQIIIIPRHVIMR